MMAADRADSSVRWPCDRERRAQLARLLAAGFEAEPDGDDGD
jgi:hypothetical protein